MDKIVNKIVSLGVPGLMFLVAYYAYGLTGAAAVTAALAALGPGGMIGGVATLLIAAGLSSVVAEYGFDAIFKAVLKKMYAKGETKSSLIAKVEKGPWTSKLKAKAIKDINRF